MSCHGTGWFNFKKIEDGRHDVNNTDGISVDQPLFRKSHTGEADDHRDVNLVGIKKFSMVKGITVAF